MDLTADPFVCGPTSARVVESLPWSSVVAGGGHREQLSEMQSAGAVKILLWTDDLMTRVRVESRWKAAGACMLGKNVANVPDLIVVDLTAARAGNEIARLRQSYPETPVLAFGPHVDGEAFKAARASGADELVARGKVVERVLAKLETRPE